jgi:hypothetical protein
MAIMISGLSEILTFRSLSLSPVKAGEILATDINVHDSPTYVVDSTSNIFEHPTAT